MTAQNHTKEKSYVYSIRDWKEYLGESALIIFSVLLALFLTEYFNGLHEKENTKKIMETIVVELKHNKQSIKEMEAYDRSVLASIDSALVNKERQAEIIVNDEIHLKKIIPSGVLYRYLDDDAWAIAKSNNIMSKIDVETASILTKVYEDQGRVKKVEDDVAKLVFDRASRDPKQVHLTLMLIRDIYHAWVVDRTPGLIYQIDNALKKIDTK